MSQPDTTTGDVTDTASDTEKFVGKGLNRVEDHRILTGRAEYIHDIAPDNSVSMGFLRSAHARADIVNIDVSAAEAHPDCRLILTGEDIAAEYHPMPCGLNGGEVKDAFESADNVIENQYSWGRISGVPLETAGVVAEYDTETDSFHIDCNIQLHTLVDDTIYEPLGYDPDDVILNVPPDVGGSYGTKIALHRYCTLAAIASQQLDGTPVKYVEDRIENMKGGDMHSSDREYSFRIAFDDDGIIQGIDVNFTDDFGAYPRYPVNQTFSQQRSLGLKNLLKMKSKQRADFLILILLNSVKLKGNTEVLVIQSMLNPV